MFIDHLLASKTTIAPRVNRGLGWTIRTLERLRQKLWDRLARFRSAMMHQLQDGGYKSRTLEYEVDQF
jgi:hypothetical protein